jgi:hypothetical protein
MKSDAVASLEKEQLLQQLQSTIQKFHQMPNNALRQQVMTELDKFTIQIEDIEARLPKADNNQVWLNDAFELTAFQNSLSDQELVLYFDTGPDTSHVWAIDNGAIKHKALLPEAMLASQINKLLNQLKMASGQVNVTGSS